jgi:transposase
MPARRVSMRKIREVLRLVWVCGLTRRRAAQSSGLGRTTVREYVERAEAAGLGWAQVETLGEEELEARLYPPPVALPPGERPLPDWAEVHAELRHKGVTLALLWEEYRAAHPQGYRYSRFCDLYRQWRGRLDLVMRQDHKAGEVAFLDYAGLSVPVVDRHTGELRQAQVFVAVLGASNYTFAEATWSQGLADWIGSQVRAFEFFGAVPQVLVSDNLRSAVSRSCRYEPELNPTYQEMAAHYGVAVVPARVRKPRDKAKVEVGVQVVERWILARLRKRTFFSLAELNAAIRELLVELNERPFQKLAGSRRAQFEQVDRPAMRPLPAERFAYAEWRKARVAIDYHVEVAGHYYSVPYQLVGRSLDVRLSSATVECFERGKRVASHPRSSLRGRHTTVAEHMPRAHRDYAQWTPERLIRWAAQAGPAVAQVVETILASRAHPQHGFRPCLGLMRLGQHYGGERLEAACGRALGIGSPSYRSVRSILEKGLDQKPLPDEEAQPPLPFDHDNVRGAAYYQPGEEPSC